MSHPPGAERAPAADDGISTTQWPLPAPRAWVPGAPPSDRVDTVTQRTATAWAVPQTKRTVAATDHQLGVF